jgi:hypothetical protein
MFFGTSVAKVCFPQRSCAVPPKGSSSWTVPPSKRPIWHSVTVFLLEGLFYVNSALWAPGALVLTLFLPQDTHPPSKARICLMKKPLEQSLWHTIEH